jgi:hypothetical protein
MSNFISYIFEPTTNDNLVTWGYLDNLLQVTPTEAEIAEERAEMEQTLAQMSEEDRAQYGPRIQRQMERLTEPQEVPMYRVMTKTDIPGVLVERFNKYERNRYIRY